jgi:ADP-ribose pyrophosphatase YjhB (NUDIX family)
MTEYHNPTPVVVGLVPVLSKEIIGLLTIRRGIKPGIGKLAMPGGFLEMEPWETGLSREVWEETGVKVPAFTWTCFDAASTEPNPNRVMIYGKTRQIYVEDIPTFEPNPEVQEIGLIYSTEDLEDEFAFPLHYQKAARWFRENCVILNSIKNAPKGFCKLP